MNKKLTRALSLLAVCLGLFTALPAKAASLQLVPNWGASGVPTNLSMYIYVPDNLAPNPPILVLLHYWGGGAGGVFAEAQAGGIVAAADQYGFIMVVPQNPDCWDYSSPQSLTHDGGGQTQGIAQMVNYTVTNYHANANRVYVTGTSCGGMMTEALLGVYPDIFKAGAEFAGVPIGGAWTPVTHTAQQWGDLARACYPGYSGHRPRVQLWHGTADGTVNYTNQLEAIMQWGNVLGLSTNPTYSNTVTIGSITNQFTHQVWVDACGNTVLDAWSEIGGGHGTDANLNAQYVISFLGLDKVGPVDPEDPDIYCGHVQRGRPHLNAARTTFVGDNGERLRGPFTSTEWTTASTDVAMIKGMGFNALHLYAESFDISYPTNGSTAPGYSVANIDSIVAQTRTNGLYLIMTIGNGAWNGDYNAAYITNFWKFYAARYANETHVLFEIQNEPVAWGPPYAATNATPPGALDMEVAAYKTIRTYAPDTPVLLFTYAVLGDSGGASAALTDIHAFNTNVFGNANAVWTNEAVGFHGYAGASATSNAVSQIIAAGYPCFMTEFDGGVWGTGVGGLDAYAVANLERLGVSWLTFQYIPPTGVSDDVTDPRRYMDVINWTGLSWTPDFGNWPPLRGPYGNGGYPWTTPDYTNNFLTGSLRIQAENFDSGGEGVAYHELTATNLGGQYRTNEAVDIETTTDTGGGYDVTSTAGGEWLEYTLNVSQPGLYNLALRVAGTSAGSVQVLAGGINGTNLTGAWAVPATGGAQTWTTISNTVFLTPGQQVLHLDVLAGGFNLNWLQLSPVTSAILADGSYKLLNRASAFAVTGVSASNLVNAATYTGATAQRWNLQHLGGGEYKITSAENGWSLVSGSGFYFWINNHYLIQSTGDGYYRIVPAGSGFCFETTASDPTVIDEKVSAGSVNQQWAILSPTAPAFPTGLSAVAAGSTTANLTWNAVTGATSYNVKRSTNSGGAYTTIATGVTTTNYTNTGLTVGVKYFYVVSAVVGGVESLNSTEAQLRYPKLNGTIIGTAGSWGNSGNTIAKVFDNNLSTFFDAPTGNGDWVGLDFGVGVSNVITQINYCPRSGFESRMVGGVFQGANQSNFSDAIALFTLATQPSSGAFTTVNVTNATAFRYVRYFAPDGGYGNVAELEFYGYPFSNPVSAPAGLSALAVSTSQINLTWNALTNATSYNLKRSTTNGGPYTSIASGVTATNYSDSGLAGGTTYYYVVSAMVSTNETPNSAQAAATTPVPLILLGRWLSEAANFAETSGYSPAGTFDGFVVASGSYYFTNDVPPNATGVSARLNNSGIGIINTSLAWDSHYTNTFDNKITNSFTVTCWAKGLPGGWNPWVSKFGENGKGWQLRTDGTSPTYPCWTIRNNSAGTVTLGTAVYGNPEDMASRSIAVNDGKWHHYAGTFDAGLGTRCLYVDGELAAAETGNAVYSMAVTNRLMLGARDGGSGTSSSGGYGSYFTGNLYDVRIYGSAASQTQIRSIAGLTPPSLTNHVVSGNQMVLTWSWGTLLQATNLLGPWTPVPAASPYTNSPIAPQQFFRISNP
jgi:endoglucanase